MLQSSTLRFIKDLKKNNNKPWFDANRSRYEAAKADFEQLVQAILDRHSKSDPDLNGLTAKECIYRINRDVRFSKDKSPYKSNFGASMDRGGKKSGFAGYYIHCEPGQSFVGGGLWMPPPPVLKKVRQEIDYSFDEVNKILTSKKFREYYGEFYKEEGMKLSKLPHGFEKDNPAAEYLKYRSWLLLHPVTDAELTSKDLVKNITDGYRILQPFIKFLNRAIEE